MFEKRDFMHFPATLDWNSVGKIGHDLFLVFALDIKRRRFNWLIKWYACKPKPEEGMEAVVYPFDMYVT